MDKEEITETGIEIIGAIVGILYTLATLAIPFAIIYFAVKGCTGN